VAGYMPGITTNSHASHFLEGSTKSNLSAVTSTITTGPNHQMSVVALHLLTLCRLTARPTMC